MSPHWQHVLVMDSLNIRLQEYRDGRPSAEPFYNRLVAQWRANGVGSGAPSPGQRLEGFGLTNPRGKLRTLQALVAQGPIVLCFIRGHWCPYCQAELAAWKLQESRLAERGGRLVVVTAETARYADGLSDIVGEDVEILCDAHHGLALATGLACWSGEDLLTRYHDNGLDFQDIYGSGSGLLTVPATFVIDEKAMVRYSFVDPDFRSRAEPSDVISVLKNMA